MPNCSRWRCCQASIAGHAEPGAGREVARRRRRTRRGTGTPPTISGSATGSVSSSSASVQTVGASVAHRLTPGSVRAAAGVHPRGYTLRYTYASRTRPDHRDRAHRAAPRAERQAAILQGAAAAFARSGYAATSMEEIAAASGITKLIVYRHFDSKEALYRAVLQRVFDRLAEEFLAGYASRTDGAGSAPGRCCGSAARTPPASSCSGGTRPASRSSPSTRASCATTRSTRRGRCSSRRRPDAAGVGRADRRRLPGRGDAQLARVRRPGPRRRVRRARDRAIRVAVGAWGRSAAEDQARSSSCSRSAASRSPSPSLRPALQERRPLRHRATRGARDGRTRRAAIVLGLRCCSGRVEVLFGLVVPAGAARGPRRDRGRRRSSCIAVGGPQAASPISPAPDRPSSPSVVAASVGGVLVLRFAVVRLFLRYPRDRAGDLRGAVPLRRRPSRPSSSRTTGRGRGRRGEASRSGS